MRIDTNSGVPPLVVNSGAKVANLNVDRLDGKDSSAFLTSAWYRLVGPATFGVADGRTGGLKATLSCDAGDMLMSGGWMTATINNPNVIQGSHNCDGTARSMARRTRRA